jgi:hypothetical protein
MTVRPQLMAVRAAHRADRSDTTAARRRVVGEWQPGRHVVGPRKAGMASKDKGGRSTKTPAAKTAKEKRQAKKEKKTVRSFTGREG